MKKKSGNNKTMSDMVRQESGPDPSGPNQTMSDSFNEEISDFCIDLLEEIISSEGESYSFDPVQLEGLEKLKLFLERRKRNKQRHYCYKCGAKRNEDEMQPFKQAAFGKMSWICNSCGDSRFKQVHRRKVYGDGNSVLAFRMGGKK